MYSKLFKNNKVLNCTNKNFPETEIYTYVNCKKKEGKKRVRQFFQQVISLYGVERIFNNSIQESKS